MTPTDEIARLRANYRLCERRLADARRERDTAETDLIALRANLKLERECVVALGKSFDRLRAENKAQRDLLTATDSALDEFPVAMAEVGSDDGWVLFKDWEKFAELCNTAQDRIRAHLAQSEPGAGKEGGL